MFGIPLFCGEENSEANIVFAHLNEQEFIDNDSTHIARS